MTAVGQGSAGNVIAALASLFIPGLGQLVQGRFLAAIFFFLASVILWFVIPRLAHPSVGLFECGIVETALKWVNLD
jgi:TM2 domain-containing membrane protein YozV